MDNSDVFQSLARNIFMIVPFIEQKIPEFSDLSKRDKRISSQISYPDIHLLIISCYPILPEP